MIKLGITGHMNLKAVCMEYYKKQLHNTLKEMKEKYDEVIIYSALAEGADRLIVDVALELGIDYIAVLPMPKSTYSMDFNELSAIRFYQLLEFAQEIVEMPLLSTDPEKRALQYEASGIYISDRCDILIALWDGTYTNLTGGTSEIVNYHTSKQYYVLYHLLVSRDNDLTNNMIEFKIYEKQ